MPKVAQGIVGKNVRYIRYIAMHKFYVFLECWKLGIPWRGIVHDLSKFHPAEWIPYLHSFYGDEVEGDEKKLRREAFDKAWLRHIHRNPHHWQHWVLQEDSCGASRPLPIPDVYLREMLADWRAMGHVQGSKPLKQWYENARKIMKLEPRTECELHRLMNFDELPG
jgi:hypothetical protein